MSRTFTADHGLVPIDLLRSAFDHLGAAEQLFGSSASYFDSAGYLAHLAVECLLKAWLLEVAGKFVDTHKLCRLYDEIIKSHGAPALSAQQKAVLALLDTYAQLRYPNRTGPTEVGTEDLPAIQALMQTLYERLPDELVGKLSRVDVLQKGGRVLMKKKIVAP